MNILIGADFVPTKSNMSYFENANIDRIVDKKLQNILKEADYRIFNLEVPLCDGCKPIKKCGPALVASEKSINGYSALGINLFTLANNHILDQDELGLKRTISILEENNIGYVGAGIDENNANKSLVFEAGDRRIGIYACVEHEFSSASKKSYGANAYDPYNAFREIGILKNKCEYIIVLYHGGKEHYRYPSPELQRTCRGLIDYGADIVICQHSHCIGCKEVYNDKLIVYGQGNFLFDDSDGNECWETGLLISIHDNGMIEFVPLIKNGNAVKSADRLEADLILNEFEKRSNEIKIPGFIESKYREFSRENIIDYLTTFLGMNKKTKIYKLAKKVLNKRVDLFYVKGKYTENRLLAILNFIECEAHRELIIDGLKALIYESS